MMEFLYEPLPSLAVDRVIALGNGTPKTLGEFLADIRRVGAELPAATPHEETREVLIACGDRYFFAVAVFAAWAHGYAAALPPALRPQVLRELAARSSVVLTLHDGESDFGLDLRELSAEAPLAASDELRIVLPSEAHVVTMYTSGSTGEPQPVKKCARQLLGEVEVLNRKFGDEIERVLCSVPPRHIYGLLFGLLLPVRAGACFVRETPLHIESLCALARQHDADTLIAVPVQLQGLDAATDWRPGKLRHAFSSGAPLPDETFESLRQRAGMTVTEILGSTETGGIGYRRRARAPYEPFQDVRVEVGLDDQLLLYSPRCEDGANHAYPCQDRIERLPSGQFHHLGRKDRVVKVGGTRVSLDELEQRARALPGIHDVAILAQKVSGARSHEVLLIASGEGWDASRMRQALSPWFEPVALPRRYRFVEALPREATGKLRRDTLLSLFEKPAAAKDRPDP